MMADVNAIIVGMNGRWAMLRAVFGSSDAGEASSEDLPEFGPGMMGR